MLKAIHAQESREAADQKARAIIEDLRANKMSKAADLVEQAVHETLTYYAFPGHPLAEDPDQQSAGADHAGDPAADGVVGAFPDGQSCLNLAAAGCATSRERHGRRNAT